MNAQTRFLADNETVRDRTIASFHVNGDDASALFLEFNDNRTSYPPHIGRALEANGYLETDSEPLYLIPLGQGLPVTRDDTSTDALTALGQIKPVRFADPEGTQLAPLRDNGRLYIFVGGYLWRELVVSDDGNSFRDINLAKYQGCDQRPPDDGMETEVGAITIPHRLNGGPVLLQVAFSEVPWSWALIEILGGLADEDPRYLPDLPEHTPYRWHRDNVDHALRLQRTTLLNVNSFDGQGSPDTLKQTALIGAWQANNHYNQPDENGLLALPQLSRADIQDNLPVAALQDPLGIANNMVGLIQLHTEDLKSHLASIEGDPDLPDLADAAPNSCINPNAIDKEEHGKSALYAYQLLFNEELHEWSQTRRGRRYEDKSPHARNLRAAASRIDRNELEKILRVEERRELRQHIRSLRQALVHWLEGNLADGSPANSDQPLLVSCQQALLDLAWLPVPDQNQHLQVADWDSPHTTPDYSALWASINGILSGAGPDPSVIDSNYDANPDPDYQPGKDPIQTWLASLLAERHPLHRALFPSPGQIPLEQDYQPDTREENIFSPPQGSDFRASAFAALFSGEEQSDDDDLSAFDYLKKVRAQASTTLACLLFHFQQQWQKALEQKSTEQADILMRLTKASGEKDLRGLRLVKEGQTLPEGKIIIEAEATFNGLKRQERRSIVRQGGLDTPGRVALFDPKTLEAVGSTDITDLTLNRGLPQPLDKPKWQQQFRIVSNDGLARASATVIAIPSTSEYIRHWHQPDTPASPGTTTATLTLKATSKVLPPIWAVLEVYNLQSINSEVDRGGWDNNKKIKAGYSLLALVYALTDTAIQLAGEDKTVRALSAFALKKEADWANQLVKGNVYIGKLGVNTFKGIGFLLSAAGAIMVTFDAIGQWQKANRTRAVVHGVEAAALAGAAASQLGRAVVSKMAERAILLRLGPWGWAFFGISIIASVIAHSLELSPIERWASYGPFSKDTDLRFTEEYEGLNAKQIYRALLSLLLAPQINVQQHKVFPPTSARVEIRTPAVGQTGKIEHYAYWKGSNEQLFPLKPRGWHPLLADESDPASRIGIVAWYHSPDTRGSVEVIVEARYWHKETQDWLPFDPTKPQQYIEDDSINMKTGGWSRSQPIAIEGHQQT